jgi:predicted hotdog family 3-hydroxylacyl-ACP dehydratase
MDTVERAAQAFCEASGFYKWPDTRGSVREWYLAGARAVLEALKTIEATQKSCVSAATPDIAQHLDNP